MILTLLGAVIIFLLIKLISSNEDNKIQKEFHLIELGNTQTLYSNPKLNENYENVIQICNKINSKYPFMTLRTKSPRKIVFKGQKDNKFFIDTSWHIYDDKIILKYFITFYHNTNTNPDDLFYRSVFSNYDERTVLETFDLYIKQTEELYKSSKL